jgi:hypothetical protein
MAQSKQASKLERCREWLWYVSMHTLHEDNHHLCCFVCGVPVVDIYSNGAFDVTALLSGDSSDGCLIHHINGNRLNNDIKNLAACHRGCHRSWHMKFENNGVDARTEEAIKIWGPTPEFKFVDSSRGKFHQIYARENDERLRLLREIALLKRQTG